MMQIPTPEGEHGPLAGSSMAWPLPAEICQLTKAIRSQWSARERRARAGLARKLQSLLAILAAEYPEPGHG